MLISHPTNRVERKQAQAKKMKQPMERGHNLIGMATATLNPNPVVYSSLENLDLLRQQLRSGELNEEGDDPIDDLEVFDILFFCFPSVFVFFCFSFILVTSHS